MKTARRGLPAMLCLLVSATTCAIVASCRGTPQAGPLGQVAWVSDDSLWARALPTGKPRLLGVAAELSRLVYSPSGRWLAVRARDGVRLVRTDGAGGEKLAGPEGTAYAWAPTDDRVAYVAGGNLLLTRAGGIGTVLVDRTRAPAVTSVAWSPDGQWLAFALDAPSRIGGAPAASTSVGASPGAPASAFWRMPARGGRLEPLGGIPPGWTPRAPAWSADGAPALVLADGRHQLVVVRGAQGTASLHLGMRGSAEGKLVARIVPDRAGAAGAGGPANARQPWTDLVAYSAR